MSTLEPNLFPIGSDSSVYWILYRNIIGSNNSSIINTLLIPLVKTSFEYLILVKIKINLLQCLLFNQCLLLCYTCSLVSKTYCPACTRPFLRMDGKTSADSCPCGASSLWQIPAIIEVQFAGKILELDGCFSSPCLVRVSWRCSILGFANTS